MVSISLMHPRCNRFCARRDDEPNRRKTNPDDAGQKTPGGFRILWSRTSARELHPRNPLLTFNTQPSLRRRTSSADRKEGLPTPISSEPAPSHRPWTLLAGATLPAMPLPYHYHSRSPRKTGTFYFAQNRKFLLCVDRLLSCAFPYPAALQAFYVRGSYFRATNSAAALPSTISW